MKRIDALVDVTAAAGLRERQTIAATVFMPDAPPHAVLFAGPGGGYSRQYFDLRHPAVDGYSQAEHHVRAGFAVVAYDHLGVGASSTTQLTKLSLARLAAANDDAVRQLHERLVEGDFGKTPRELKRIGLGQAMGGAITIVAQARHATFDAIGVLGFSGIHTCLPYKAGVDLDFAWAFHWGETPKVLIEADMSGGYPMRQTTPSWGSLTLPPCAADLMLPGCVAKEAARIEVPVFIGMGERDVCPVPADEPGAYPKARFTELCVVERMAHMHNFAPTRAKLWERIEAFSRR